MWASAVHSFSPYQCLLSLLSYSVVLPPPRRDLSDLHTLWCCGRLKICPVLCTCPAALPGFNHILQANDQQRSVASMNEFRGKGKEARKRWIKGTCGERSIGSIQQRQDPTHFLLPRICCWQKRSLTSDESRNTTRKT